MSTPLPTPDRTVKVAHLVMGLLFAGVVALWALVASRRIGPDEVAFLAPGVLVAAGVLGLVSSVLSARNRRRRPAAVFPPAAGRLVEEPRHEADEPDEPDDLEHTAPVTPTRRLTQQDRPEETP